MLSMRQEQVLKFIKLYQQKNNFSPTQREIQVALKISSCSFLNRSLNKLEATGFIRRKRAKSHHNIELCRSPYSLPLLGKIAAGTPIEAIPQSEEIVITEKLLGENRYLLEVKGDSMLEDNICDGDWIVCERCHKAPSGSIVIALIRQEETTLKRIFYERNSIRLEPANKNYQPQHYRPDEIAVQGKFIGLIRLKK